MLIHAEKANFPIDWMCRQLKVARASYYRWLAPTKPTKTHVRHAELEAQVLRVFDREKGKAGRDQLTILLGQEGVSIAPGTVGAIMRKHGLKAVRMRAWKKTTTADPDARTEHIKNHMLDKNGKRDFTSAVPGTRLCGDITYLRTGSGWLYLATVIDLSNRLVVGWSMATHMRTALIIDALSMVRDHGHLQPGAIFHSDRGSQYTSSQFQNWCAANHITQSMGCTGSALDNAVAESFNSSLEFELLRQQHFTTRRQARHAVADWIEEYNTVRRHSTNGMLSPVDYEHAQARARAEADPGPKAA